MHLHLQTTNSTKEEIGHSPLIIMKPLFEQFDTRSSSMLGVILAPLLAISKHELAIRLPKSIYLP